MYNSCKVIRKQISPFIHKTSVAALKFPFYFNFWRKFISSILAKERFDAIHVHDLPLVKVGVDMKMKFGVPLVVDLHENWPALIADAKHTNTFLGKLLSSNSQWQDYEQSQLQYADAIITVVDEMKDRIVKNGLKPEKVFVVSNFLNINGFPKIIVEGSKGISVFYGGGVTKDRGLEIAIQGIALLKGKVNDVKLVIAGSGSYLPELKKLSEELGVSEQVVFLGSMKQDDLLIEMMKSNIALISHLRSVQTDNSSPNKLFQYMYAEKPVLSSDCNSLKRIIESGKVGIVYKDNSAEDFVEKLMLLIEQNVDNIFGRKGRELVIEKYNWSKQQSIFPKIYESVLI
jgi:glycosyltransferase involved in cell wall biosynthesis